MTRDSTVTMACPALAAGHGTQSGCYRPSHGGGGPGPSVGPPRRAAHWQAVRLALAGSGSRAGVDSAGPSRRLVRRPQTITARLHACFELPLSPAESEP